MGRNAYSESVFLAPNAWREACGSSVAVVEDAFLEGTCVSFL